MISNVKEGMKQYKSHRWILFQTPSAPLENRVLTRFFRGVPGMAHLQLVKVQPQVFTAKCSEPQVGSRKVKRMLWMKEGAGKTSEPTHRNPMRLNGGWGCLTNRSPKGKRKTKTVNWEVVEERRRWVLPREVLRTVKPRCFQIDMVKPVEKGLSQEVSWGHSSRKPCLWRT